MTEHKGLPVAGYQPQSDEKVALVNRFKEMEERLLREIDALAGRCVGPAIEVGEWASPGDPRLDPLADPRWVAIARTKLEQGFMALNRSVFQPRRIALPGDES